MFHVEFDSGACLRMVVSNPKVAERLNRIGPILSEVGRLPKKCASSYPSVGAQKTFSDF